MYEQVEKTKENKSRSVSRSVAQKKSNVKQGVGFVDNRRETVAQRRLQDIISPVVQRVICQECMKNVNHSYEHAPTCSHFYQRTFQTNADSNAPTLTRSHSYQSYNLDGSTDRVHHHDNSHTGNPHIHSIGQWNGAGYSGRQW